MCEFFVNLHRQRIVRKFVSIDQAAGKLVVSIGREPVVHEELGLRVQGLAIAFYQAVDFCASFFGTGDRVRSCQGRDILPEAMARNEAVKIVMFEAESRSEE